MTQVPIDVMSRPFSCDRITFLMLPDGIFEIALGRQILNAYFTNSSATDLHNIEIFIESASDSGIVINPSTKVVKKLPSNAFTLISWVLGLDSVLLALLPSLYISVPCPSS